MNCSLNLITYPKTFPMDYIYILSPVAIIMSTNICEEENIDIVYYSMFYMCDIDRTYKVS